MDIADYVKLHGTNAQTLWMAQLLTSFSRASNPRLKTTNGFCCMGCRERAGSGTNTFQGDVTVFGEWIGPGIQKNVAVSQLPQKDVCPFAIPRLAMRPD